MRRRPAPGTLRSGSRRAPQALTTTPLPVWLGGGLLILLGACGGSGPEAPRAPTADAPVASTAHTYTVRGLVTQLPDPEDPTTGFFVHHEAIPDFRHLDGQVSGMDSMTMPFPVAEEVSLEGVTVGDKVEFELTVDWEADPVTEVTAVRRLDSATELRLGGGPPTQ